MCVKFAWTFAFHVVNKSEVTVVVTKVVAVVVGEVVNVVEVVAVVVAVVAAVVVSEVVAVVVVDTSTSTHLYKVSSYLSLLFFA